MNIVLETERLTLRELEQADLAALCRTLQDEQAMYAYEHAFTDEEAQAWLANQLRRYREEGFGLWGVVRKADGQFLGQCGLTLQPLGDGTRGIEVGYLFERTYWHNGYATEAAIACKEYAFRTLHADTVYSIIRENNLPSRRVAERNGMHVCGRLVKHYYGMEMPHLIYCAENPHGAAKAQQGEHQRHSAGGRASGATLQEKSGAGAAETTTRHTAATEATGKRANAASACAVNSN